MAVVASLPDLGITSYRTDADGNVVFGPNTPQEKKKTTITGNRVQKRKGEEDEVERVHDFV